MFNKDTLLPLAKTALLTFGGFLTDISLSTLLFYSLDWPLMLCGAFGLLAGGTVSYFIDLKTTFAARALPASWQGLFHYLQATALGIVIRLICLALLSWLTSWPALLSFLAAVGVANSIRYAISHFYIFRQKAE